jgi:ABC-type nitrate/sulfonate/bicarbonate transport system permease component
VTVGARIRGVLLDLARFGVFLVLWQLAALQLDSVFLPPLGEVFEAFADNFVFERVFSDVLPSLGRMAAGYLLAAVVGIAVGVLLGSNRLARSAATPLVEFLRAIPPPALIPFAILLLGLGVEMKVFVIAIGSVWPILLNTIDGVRGVDPMLYDVSRVYDIKPQEQLRRVVMPAASPQIVAGLRASLSIALILMVISEMVASTNGLGYFVLQSQRAFRIPEMWAGILVLGIVGLALNLLFVSGERRVLAWHRGMRQASLERSDPRIVPAARTTEQAA